MSRQLVVPEPSAKDILIEHGTWYEKTSIKRFKGKVLGYVTPWNGLGYDVAKIFAPKFTHISPVWLQIKRKSNLKYVITGTHDIDSNWLQDVRKNNSDIKIDVRVLFDSWTVQDYTSLFIEKKEQIALSNTLVEQCKNSKFDGVVLEVLAQIGGSLRSDILLDFVKLVAKTLSDAKLELILVIPPVRGIKQEMFTQEHFNELSEAVTAFSLMTYDFSNPQRPGPNSPINWIKLCVESLVPDPNDKRRGKILLGLNFYGNDYTVSGGGPILGHDFIKLLKSYKGKLKLDESSEENFLEVR